MRLIGKNGSSLPPGSVFAVYVPVPFRENDSERLYATIERYSFATLVNVVDGAPYVTHLPLLLDRERRTLYGHLASANPQTSALFEGQSTLAVFQGPHAYISPRWYAEPNVPTWNYIAVHAYGRAVRLDDAGLAGLLERLTARYETETERWHPGLLPDDMLSRLRKVITGFALPIERLEGKYKLSQNRSRADRQGATAALHEHGEGALAALMDEALEER